MVGHETTVVPALRRNSTSSADTWMPWITLARGPRNPVSVEQLDRRAAVLGLALLELAPLLTGVHVARYPVPIGISRDRLEPAPRDRAHAVGGDSDLDPRHRGRPRPQRVHPARNASTSGSQKRR